MQWFPGGGIRGIAALCALSAIGVGACAPQGPPDVVVVAVGALRADRLGAWGAQYPQQAMDAFAAEAIRFERAIAPASRPAPSLATLFTGVPPSRHGRVRAGARVADDRAPLAEVFRDAGYRTVAVSASPDVQDPATGLSRGFEQVLPSRDDPQRNVRDRAVTKRAMEVLNRPREGPLFLFVHYRAPRPPFEAKERFLRPGTRRYHGSLDGTLPTLASLARGEIPADTLDAAHVAGLYDAEVESVDEELLHLLEHLERADLVRRAIVVLLGEHGIALSEHGGFAYGTTLHQEMLHVPLLIRRPGGEGAGTVVSDVLGLGDVGATLLAMAGLEDPRPGAGTSRLAWLEGGAASEGRDPDAAVVSELAEAPAHASVWGPRRHRASVTTARWKLLVHPDGRRALHDLDEDPGEQRDVASEHPEVVQRLSALLPPS